MLSVQLGEVGTDYKGKDGLTLHMQKRLTSAARCAIKMRSIEVDRSKAVKLLEQNLKNGPYHCFGIHDRCSTDFCTHTHKQGQSVSSSVTESCSSDLMDDVELDDVQSKQIICTACY